MKKDLKNQILNCAVKSFLTVGYEKTTFRGIAKSLGIAAGNVTYYYPKKEDLVRDYHDLVMKAFLTKSDDAGSSPDPWEDYFLAEYRFLHFIAFDEKTARIYVSFTNVPSLRVFYIDTHEKLFLSFFPDPPFPVETSVVSTTAMCALEFGMVQSLLTRPDLDFSGIMRHIFETKLIFLGLDPEEYAAAIDHAVTRGETMSDPVIYSPDGTLLL